MLALRVRREEVAKAKRVLRRAGLLDRGRRSLAQGGFVELPLLAPGKGLAQELEGDIVVQRRPLPAMQRSPRERVLGLLSAEVPRDLLPLIPRGWDVLGDVLVLRVPEPLGPYEEAIAKAFASILGLRTVVHREGAIEGPFRKPKIRVLLGEGTETIHLEDGIRYSLDVSEVMFCAGNKSERARMGRVVREGEVVVDMFAGIGYFTLPMAVHGRPRAIYACEINSVPFDHLLRNLRLNHVRSVRPLLGDCLEVAPEGVADRVVMGYLWVDPRHLRRGLEAFRDRGILHYHALAKMGDSEGPMKEVIRGASDAGVEVRLLQGRLVKSYAPGIHHVVLDVEVVARPRGWEIPRKTQTVATDRWGPIA